MISVTLGVWPASLMAIAVCLGAGVSALGLGSADSRGGRVRRGARLVAIAATAGSAVWLADFLSSALVDGAARPTASLELILLSWALALGGAGGALSAAISYRSPRARFASGALFGMAVSAVHYVSFAALLDRGLLGFNPPFVAASLLIGASLGGAALDLFRTNSRWPHYLFVILFMVFGIAALRFTALAAVGDHPFFPTPVLFSPHTVAAWLSGGICVLSLSVVAAVKLTIRSHAKALAELREAVDAVPAAMAFFDAHDRFTLWNARYAENAKFAGGALQIGASFRSVIERSPAALAGGPAWVEQRLAHRCAQEPTEVEQAGRWYQVQERRTARGGMISVTVDITDLKRQAEILAAARDAAEAASRAKSQFLANMSHELRTPLNGILTVARTLAATALDERQREMVGLVDASAETLSSLLVDLIDAGALDTDEPEAPPPSLVAVELAALAQSVAAEARAQAAQKGLSFTLEVADDARGVVEADAAGLRRVLGLLLDNAVKFTDRGSVSLRVVRAGDTPEQVVFEVRDTGCGFDPVQTERLFEAFAQADGSLTRVHGGMGLGLRICRRLVERMGGEIAADSRPGQGAVFWVLLTLPERVPLAAAAPAPDRPLHLLYAEDHPVNCKVMQYIMASAGIALTCVENGALAVQAAGATAYDIILMDMQMPVMDGLSAIKAIRSQEAASARAPTPIIAVSAHGLPEHVAQSRAAGADRHLTKPLDTRVLLEAVAALASKAEAAGRLAA